MKVIKTFLEESYRVPRRCVSGSGVRVVFITHEDSIVEVVDIDLLDSTKGLNGNLGLDAGLLRNAGQNVGELVVRWIVE